MNLERVCLLDSVTDFVTLAKSFGAIGYYVKSTEEFSKTLEKAKESTSVPVIIAIDVDYSTNQILLNDDFNDSITYDK